MNADDQASRRYRRSSRDYTRFAGSRRARRSKRWKPYAAALSTVVALVGAVLLYQWSTEPGPAPKPVPELVASAAAEAKAPERTAALAPLNLPADDAPHGAGMEWWYYSGILDAQSGVRYAFHVAVFVRTGLIKHTVMHAALTDLQTGKRYASQTRTGGVPAQSAAGGFDFRQKGWQVSGSGPAHVVHATLDGGASITLDLRDAHPVVAHRAAGSQTPGLLDFGKSGISYYYSRPRIAARGEVAIAGKPVAVGGEVWFDHQWGDFDVADLGWNWFALHLADGSDLMIYALFDAAGRQVMTAGTRSDARGSAPLKPGEIALVPVSRWTSPETNVSYAVEWRITLGSDVLNVKPFLADSEFDARTTSANIYWEGPVKVTGSTTGEGFLELSGYERLAASAATAAAAAPAANRK